MLETALKTVLYSRHGTTKYDSLAYEERPYGRRFLKLKTDVLDLFCKGLITNNSAVLVLHIFFI